MYTVNVCERNIVGRWPLSILDLPLRRDLRIDRRIVACLYLGLSRVRVMVLVSVMVRVQERVIEGCGCGVPLQTAADIETTVRSLSEGYM